MADKMSQIYSTITKLPFANFLDCICDNNLRALIISGEPREDELISARDMIVMQYTDAIGGENTVHEVGILKEITHYRISLYLIYTLVDLLSRIYVPKWESLLIRHSGRKKFNLDWAKPEEYVKELNLALARSISFKLNLELKEIELEGLRNQNKTGKEGKPKREDFVRSLINLSDHAGFQIRENEITTFEYCQRVKGFIQYMESYNKNHQNRKAYVRS